MEDCKYEGKEKNKNKKIEMTQCSLCFLYFHNECVGLSKTSDITWWPCLQCRAVSMHVKQLQTSLEVLMSSVTDMKSELSKSVEQTSELLGKCDELQEENNALKASIAELKSEVQLLDFKSENLNSSDTSDADSSDDEDDDPSELGSLLIGDSIIRSIESITDDLHVRCLGGAKVNDIKKTIKEINPKKEKYKDLYIVCGTNDLSTQKSAEKIIKELTGLLKSAKERSENVYIAGITPRNDEKVTSEKLAKVNELLAQAATETDAIMIDNDNNFRYRDGSIDMSLLSPTDRLHLSASGTKRLLENFKINEKAKVTFGNGPTNLWQTKGDETKQVPLTQAVPARSTHAGNDPNPSTLKFRGSGNSFSNFYCSPLRMWGMSFPSSEHAYQFRKAIEMSQHTTAELIRQAPNPRQAQLIADDVKTDDRWLGIKQSVMYELLKEKSRQCPTFRHDLVASGDAHLIEDTSHDYWGRGSSGSGLNVLGRLLMTLRQNLPPMDNTISHSATWFPRKNQSFPRPNTYPPRYHSYFHRQPSLLGNNNPCRNCGERSHTLRTCRFTSPLQCHSCSEYGHKRKSCPQRQQQPQH